MIVLKLTVFLFTLNFVYSYNCYHEKLQEYGECIKFVKCKSAMNLLKIGIVPEHCDFKNNFPYVCCTKERYEPDEVLEIQPTATNFQKRRNVIRSTFLPPRDESFEYEETSPVVRRSYGTDRRYNLPETEDHSSNVNNVKKLEFEFISSDSKLETEHPYIPYPTYGMEGANPSKSGKPFGTDRKTPNIINEKDLEVEEFPITETKVEDTINKEEETTKKMFNFPEYDNRKDMKNSFKPKNFNPIFSFGGFVKNLFSTKEKLSTSEEKCLEYAKQCKKFIITEEYDIDNSRNTKYLDKFSHLAILGYQSDSGIHWACSGSLISDRYVLTAAHCINTPKYGHVKYIKIGSLFISNMFGAATYFVNSIHIHEDYRPPFTQNDIALIKLHREVKFTSTVRPACLSNKKINSLNVQVTTWNFTERNNNEYRHKHDLEFFDCKLAYSSNHLPYLKTDSQICADNMDMNEEDLGGPLEYFDKNNKMHSIVGVTSVGKRCGFSGVPGVYTRISSYLKWIENIVWPSVDLDYDYNF